MYIHKEQKILKYIVRDRFLLKESNQVAHNRAYL